MFKKNPAKLIASVTDKFNKMVNDLTDAINLMDGEVMDNELAIDRLNARNKELEGEMMKAERVRNKIAGMVD